MKLYQKLYLILYIFCFLYAPPFINNINFSLVLFLYSSIVIFIKYLKRAIKLLKSKIIFKILLLTFIYLTIYLISYSIGTIIYDYDITENFLLNIYSLFLNFFVTFVCAVYLVLKCEDYNLKIEDLIKYFIYATLIQVIIALFALVNPLFKEWTLSKMLKDTNANLINSPWITSRRFFGFSNNLLDLFGFGIGIISSLLLFTKFKNKKYVVFVPIILVLSILNSRSGILIFIIGLIFYIAYLLKYKIISVEKFIKYILLTLLLVICIYFIISYHSPNTIEWIINDFQSFLGTNKSTGTADAIFSSRFWRLPDDWRMIFGNGFSISAYSTSKVDNILYSDNGYINEIWKVGFIGLIIYISILFNITYSCVKLDDDLLRKQMYRFFFFAMLVFLIKASLQGYNPGNVIIYTLFIFLVNKNMRREEYEK